VQFGRRTVVSAGRRATSDPTPLKSPNKAGQPAAEVREERGSAKGNPPQQNAPRTQSREGAPSALERVRLAAARDRRMKFTALLHHIYDLTTLGTAYRALKREAAAGVDGETHHPYPLRRLGLIT
jgi:RNA-directed DNA polymerase